MVDVVPITHVSFVSMWYYASMAVSVLAMSCLFYFAPSCWYFLISLAAMSMLITIIGGFTLVESPMQLLLAG